MVRDIRLREEGIKDKLSKHWDSIFITIVLVIIAVFLIKIFSSPVEKKVSSDKDAFRTLKQPEDGFGRSDLKTKDAGIKIPANKVKTPPEISPGPLEVSPQTMQSDKKELSEYLGVDPEGKDVIYKDKAEQLDETLEGIRQRLKEDRQLRDLR